MRWRVRSERMRQNKRMMERCRGRGGSRTGSFKIKKKKHSFNIPLINLKKSESVQVPVYHQLVQRISIDKNYWNKL